MSSIKAGSLSGAFLYPQCQTLYRGDRRYSLILSFKKYFLAGCGGSRLSSHHAVEDGVEHVSEDHTQHREYQVAQAKVCRVGKDIAGD